MTSLNFDKETTALLVNVGLPATLHKEKDHELESL